MTRALGSWIGFLFLMINSAPFIFKTKDNSISDSEATFSDSNQDEISNRNKLDSDRMKSRIRGVECKLHTIGRRQGEIAQDILINRSDLTQKMTALEQKMESKLDQILR